MTSPAFGPPLTIVARDLRPAAGAAGAIEALLPIGPSSSWREPVPARRGPEPQTLRLIAPGVVWVYALLATILSVTQMFGGDHADGSLEQMLLAGRAALVAVVGGKVLAHWLTSGVPLVVAVPLLGVLFDMSRRPRPASMATGWRWARQVLNLLGAVGAALTLGLRSGMALVFLLVLPP